MFPAKPNHLATPRSWLLTLVACALLLPTASALDLKSKFTTKPPRLDGKIDWGEWDGAAKVRLDGGYMAIQNDLRRAYFLVNVEGQTKDDAEDLIALTFDINRDLAITRDVDLNYTLDPSTRTLALQRYVDLGKLGTLAPATRSSLAMRFDSFAADGSTKFDGSRLTFARHRVWELAIPLEEIRSKAGGKARMALKVASPANGLVIEPIRDYSRDFSQLWQVEFSAGTVLPLLADPNAILGFQTQFLELVQSVQTRDNTIPLVAGKKTVARVYLSVTGTTKAQPVSVYLHAKRNGVPLAGSPLMQSDSVPLSVSEATASSTTLFTLPDSWTSGSVTFQVTFEDAFGNEKTSSTLVRSFSTRDVPTVWIVPINSGTAASPQVPSSAEIASQQAYMKAAYPVADINFVVKPWTAIGTCSVDNAISRLRQYHSEVALAWIIGLLFSGGAPFEMPFQIYGFTSAGGGISDPIWYSGPGYGHVARGYRGTSLEGTMAHEINHNLDRSLTGTWGRHVPNGCGAAGPDPAWPYTDDDIQAYGFDTRLLGSDSEEDPVIPDGYPDFMSYCQSGASPTKWISPYRYQHLYDTFAPGAGAVSMHRAGLQTATVQPTLLHISGLVFPDGTGTLDPLYTQPGTPSEDPGAGGYAIELRDTLGKAVGRITFGATFAQMCEEDGIPQVAFDFLVTPPRSFHSVALLYKEKVLDQATASLNKPNVSLLAPNGGESWKGVQTVQWKGTDGDRGATLLYSLLHSPDGGANWVPVARNVKGTSLAVDFDTLPGGGKCKMRVMASDGFHSDQDDSDLAFSVNNKPPAPVIRSPKARATLAAGGVVHLEGDATDLEDPNLPEASFRWALDDKIIGTGRTLDVQLAEGKHTLTLTARDGDGSDGAVEVPIAVVAPTGRIAAVAQEDGKIRLQWPITQPGLLQAAPDVTGPYLEAAVEAQADGANENVVVFITPQMGQMFYRLLLAE